MQAELILANKHKEELLQQTKHLEAEKSKEIEQLRQSLEQQKLHASAVAAVTTGFTISFPPQVKTVWINVGSNTDPPISDDNTTFTIAVEPVQSTASLIRSHRRVIVVTAAISDFTGFAKFYIYSAQGVSSSLSSINERANWTGQQHKRTSLLSLDVVCIAYGVSGTEHFKGSGESFFAIVPGNLLLNDLFFPFLCLKMLKFRFDRLRMARLFRLFIGILWSLGLLRLLRSV